MGIRERIPSCLQQIGNIGFKLPNTKFVPETDDEGKNKFLFSV